VTEEELAVLLPEEADDTPKTTQFGPLDQRDGLRSTPSAPVEGRRLRSGRRHHGQLFDRSWYFALLRDPHNEKAPSPGRGSWCPVDQYVGGSRTQSAPHLAPGSSEGVQDMAGC